MDILNQLIHNSFLIKPFFIAVLVQLTKIVYVMVKEKKINKKVLLLSSGIISTRAAMLSSLIVLIGKEVGVQSQLFAISVIFCLVILYDTRGIQKEIKKQADILKIVISKYPIQEDIIGENIGHRSKEVLCGVVVGFWLSIFI